MNLFEFFVKGGPLMYVLLLFSILVLAIIIERWLELRKVMKRELQMQSELQSVATTSGLRAAMNKLVACPSHRILRRGLGMLNLPYEVLQEGMQQTASHEIHQLEKRMGLLSTLSAVAPLVGFLGTVTGMVKVFQNIQLAGGGVDVSLLAGGIWEAMLTTIGGLVVGIIALMFYNGFVSRIEDIGKTIETNVSILSVLYYRSENEDRD